MKSVWYKMSINMPVLRAKEKILVRFSIKFAKNITTWPSTDARERNILKIYPLFRQKRQKSAFIFIIGSTNVHKVLFPNSIYGNCSYNIILTTSL